MTKGRPDGEYSRGMTHSAGRGTSTARTHLVRRWAVFLVMLVLLVSPLASVQAAPPAAPTPLQSGPAAAGYELRMSFGANQDAPLADAGVLAGAPSIAVTPTAGVERVRYYVDPPAGSIDKLLTGVTPFAVAEQAPFALGRQGGFDTASLADGPHTIVAVIELADGRILMKMARVQVHNGGPALLFDADAAAGQPWHRAAAPSRRSGS